jgi:hypothetical protein
MPELFSNIFYNTYCKNIYSQNGEDGIIEEILKRLDISNGCVSLAHGTEYIYQIHFV